MTAARYETLYGPAPTPDNEPALKEFSALMKLEPFQRGAKRIRIEHAGVGLGLAIVKSITQAHDGTLTLTPRTAGGLCVTVELPAAPTPNGTSESERPHDDPRVGRAQS